MPSSHYQRYLAELRSRSPQRRGTRAAVKSSQLAPQVIDGLLNTQLREVAARLRVPRETLAGAIERHFSLNYEQLQREARIRFILDHWREMTNAQFAEKFGMVSTSVSKLVSRLKREGLLPQVRGYGGKSMPHFGWLPLQRNPVAYRLVLLISWLKQGQAFSTREIASLMQIYKQSAIRILRSLAKEKLVIVKRQGKNLFCSASPRAYAWIRKMDEVMRKREEFDKYTPLGLQRMINRRKEMIRLMRNAANFIADEKPLMDSPAITTAIEKINQELQELQTQLAKKLG